MYEAQKAEFERLLVKSELEPTPGSFWIEEDEETGRFHAVEGKCCVLSPAILVQQAQAMTTWSSKSLAATVSLPKLAHVYGMETIWLQGAQVGFDAETRLDSTYVGSGSYFADGYAWGAYMRAKYVRKGVADAG